MKRIILILAALAAWTAAAATPNRTATEAYVTNKIAAAVAALPAPDYSTNNTELVETIQTTAPAPDLSGYLPKSGGTLTGSLHIKTGANEMLDLYNDDPYLFGRVTVDWLTHEDGPSTLSLWDRFRNIHYDFPTNGGTVAMLENFPTNVSAFENDAGYLTGYTETDPTISAWAKAANKPTYTASEVGATTPEDVTAAIREQSLGGIWDEALQVWWTPVMRNGSLTYQATTNVNLNAEN